MSNENKPSSISILASMKAPALDTLPDDWRRVVRNLEQTVYVQSVALAASEQVMAQAADLGESGAVGAALDLLHHGRAEIGKLLAGEIGLKDLRTLN